MTQKPISIYWVDSSDSTEFTQFTTSLSLSSVLSLDAEWKPVRRRSHQHESVFPTIALLQIACRLGDSTQSETPVFLLDLLSIQLTDVYEVLSDVFVSPRVLKLGFRFKQDLAYLSSTFCSQGCDAGFERVEPYLDIMTVYNHLINKEPGKKTPKQNKSLATICKEVLGISISKELQCSDWSLRPLTEEQKAYAAMDAHCLLDIFNAFQIREESSLHNGSKHSVSHMDLGLKDILEEPTVSENILRNKICDALDLIRASLPSSVSKSTVQIHSAKREASRGSSLNTAPLENSLLQIVWKYGENIVLNESDKVPKKSKKNAKRKSAGGSTYKDKQLVNIDSWHGPPPWDLSLGGDGSPKFLCDVMVEGLAKHLRCVGVDAAVPYSKKPETRDLIYQAQKEKRVLLTRDAKLFRHEYLIENQIYRVKSLLKNEQLLEVIETFQLNINEDQLMSRCTKCNGKFIQKPLTTGEAVEAAKGFQVIPNCLFDKNLQFWQCMDCNQLYWEGTQYHNAVQKFIDVCKLNT